MGSMEEIIMALIILSDMALLGISRLRRCITIVAFQGLILGCYAILAQIDFITYRIILIAAGSIIIKGIVLPVLLKRSTEESSARHENEPFVGYILSLFFGLAVMCISLWLGSKLPVKLFTSVELIVPTALTTIFTGLFLIVARKNLLTQCLGYIVLENGIYIIGVVSVVEIPALVELGILLDVFVAVLVMSIAIHSISREFHHLDADKLSTLKG